MASPAINLISTVCLLAFAPVVAAQRTGPAILPQNPFAAGANVGLTLAQTNAAIEQSRLFRDTTQPAPLGVNANGDAISGTESTSSNDDSFGAQLILKSQERPRTVVVSGGVSLIYTSNVALTRNDTRGDAFAIVDAGMGWSPRLGNNLEASFGVHAALFRYVETTELDFQNLGASAGLAWTPPALRGFALFGRYDFTELLDCDGNQILMDHSFTLGLQRSVAFGRSHGVTFGAIGMAGISDPSAAQRQQLGAFLNYRIQLTRKLETDVLVRPAVHFYNARERADYNQIVSWTVRYRASAHVDLNAFVSYGLNRSDRSAFNYGALSSGAGLGANIRF